MPADEKKDKEVEQQQEQGSTEQEGSKEESIDFAEMDLSVESVEERISPSETNVFDK